MNKQIPVSIVMAAAIVLWPSTGHGQNAHGDGHALDANMQTGSGGHNPDQAPIDFGAGNAVITGNVTGLGYFHGDVDYTAPGEFRDAASDDELFRYRARSYDVGVEPVRGVRGLAGPLEVYREQATPEAGYYGVGQNVNDRFAGPVGPTGSALRLPASVAATRQFDRPSVTADSEPLGYVAQQDGRILEVRATPLLGVRLRQAEVEPQDDRPDLRLNPVRPVSDDEAAAPQPPSTQTFHAGSPTGPSGEQLQPKDDQGEATDDESQHAADMEGELLDTAEDALEQPGEDVYLDLLRQIYPGRDVAAPGESESHGIGPKDVESLIKSLDYTLPPIATLAGQREDRVNQHLRDAESLMLEGQYLQATDQYERAMQLAPANPMARVGHVHAQLGAGMFRSAAASLRRLLEAYPELIAAKYEPHLLPSPDRLAWLEQELQRTIDTGRQDPRDPGLLLAYLGYQTGSASWVDRGLAAAAGGEEDPLVTLLEGIWMERTDAADEQP